jgi:hypothetical protein
MKVPSFIISTLVGVILIGFAIHYLQKLEECLCAQGKAVLEEQKANLQHLKRIEILLLILLFTNSLFAFQSRLTPLLSTLFFFVILAVYVIFVMNVYKLYQSMPSDCECALKWPRFYIYLQALIMTAVLITFVVAILLMVYSAASKKAGLLLKVKGRK